MAGQKRDYEGNTKMARDPPRTRFTAMFEGFRDELDQHHDRRERIIKASRDVTALSKKIIFALQRVKIINSPLPPAVATTVTTHLSTIADLLTAIAPDLAGINRHRYAWQLRGLEELVEALALSHYLTTQTVPAPAALVASSLPAGLALTPHDYLNGVMDLFGEMMRFATVLAARDGAELVGGGARGGGRTILGDMHVLGSAVETLPHIAGSAWEGKVKAMRASVAKVEKLGYGLAIRGGERPAGWMPEEDALDV